jgi:hypothetical protein
MSRIGKDITCGFLPCCIMPVMDELGLESVEEAFHRGIVVGSWPCPFRPTALGVAPRGRNVGLGESGAYFVPAGAHS